MNIVSSGGRIVPGRPNWFILEVRRFDQLCKVRRIGGLYLSEAIGSIGETRTAYFSIDN